jgi:hypothetical protein
MACDLWHIRSKSRSVQAILAGTQCAPQQSLGSPHKGTAMQTLNLSGTRKNTEGRLKSLLWPTIDNAWDVDYLGQQGFWICLAAGTFSFIFIYFSTVAIAGPSARVPALIVGTATFFVYFVGGMGYANPVGPLRSRSLSFMPSCNCRRDKPRVSFQ